LRIEFAIDAAWGDRGNATAMARWLVACLGEKSIEGRNLNVVGRCY
jgi:hypothetical protein